jgi:aminoglycoside phosphotransferase (APT) family kinase protein
MTEVAPELAEWVRDVTGARAIRIERRSAGGSRAGYTVDAEREDGTTAELWLRSDTGVGPQSNGPYTVRREAAVYRQLHGRGMRVAEVVAVHPTIDAFLMKRLYGRNWFSEVQDPEEQVRIARDLMEQLAVLHRIDVRSLDLPELGPVRTIREHVVQELDIWDAQFRAHDEPEPTIELALAWLRRQLPEDGDWPLVLVQGDTGPGNFMFDAGRLVAVTDWELAHFGDLHDDLAWIYVHDLQERFPDLPTRLGEYARLSGHPVDPVRLRYFLVLAQTRCAIGTRGGFLARDSRGEIASHLIYTTLHTRALADALAAALGTTAHPPKSLADPGESPQSWLYDVALDDLRATIVPAIEDGFASRRAKGVARLVKYLREQERLAAPVAAAEREQLGSLLGSPVEDVPAARRELCRRIASGQVDDLDVVSYCIAHWARRTEVVRPAMGSLADRRYSPLP